MQKKEEEKNKKYRTWQGYRTVTRIFRNLKIEIYKIYKEVTGDRTKKSA